MILVENKLHVTMNHIVECQACGAQGRLERGCGVHLRLERQVLGTDHVIHRFEQGCFEHAGHFANVPRPGVQKQPPQRGGTQCHGTMLVAGADPVQQGLGDGSDILPAHAQGRDGEPHRGETKRKVGQQLTLPSQLAQ